MDQGYKRLTYLVGGSMLILLVAILITVKPWLIGLISIPATIAWVFVYFRYFDKR